MKLTNKILLAALVLLLISFTAFRIMFNNRVELVPNPFNHGLKDTTFTMGRISKFEIKGNYSVDFIKSDFDSIKIAAPDNLIDKYTEIEQKGETLFISEQTDLSKYPFEVKIRIYSRKIESIHAGRGPVITLEKFVEGNLEVTAIDSTIINAEDCCFQYVKVSTKDKAVISIENTINAIVDVQNGSSVFLTVDNGEVSGTKDKNAELILLGDVRSNKVIKTGNEIVKGGSKHE